MHRIAFSLLLIPALFLPFGDASSRTVNHYLADGTPVPEGTDFLPPAPAGGSLPAVRYPKQFAVAGVQGHFAADVVVSATGEVVDVIVKRRIHRQLDQGLVKLLRQVEFEPATLNGEPVAAMYRATYDFWIN